MLRRVIQHRLFKATAVYAFFNLLKASIPFLLLPVLTRYLSPTDYGTIATFEILLQVLTILVGLNLTGAVGVNFFKLPKADFPDYIGSSIQIVLINFLCVFGLIILFKGPLGDLLKFPEHWLPIIVFTALANFFVLLTMTIWQVSEKPLAFGVFQTGQTAFNMGLSLWFLMGLGWGWEGRIWGIVISTAVFGVVGILLTTRKEKIRLNGRKDYVRDNLQYGIPLIPHTLASWVMMFIDRIFLNSMVSVATTGLYTVACQIGLLINFLMQSFNRAWSPFLYQHLQKDQFETKVKIVKFTYLSFAVLLVSAYLLTWASPLILKIFVAPEYHGAAQFIFWIALGGAANGMYYMVVNYIDFMKKTYLLAWVTGTSATLNIVLNYFLIRSEGAIGAAHAATITLFTSFFLVWYLSSRVCPMPWDIWNKRAPGHPVPQEGR